MYDKSVIEKHLISLNRDLQNLEKYRKVSETDFHNNLDLLWIIERGIFLCIQNIFDIFSHIAASDLNGNWDSYSDIADVIFENKLINDAQRDLLISMAGFRNRLSHNYLGLDIKVLVDIVTNRLDDLHEFARIISKYSGLHYKN